MKNTYRIIPTYTGDTSGVASALYELGGMTVMHDPSGCNSTYNTHDETRWYEEESLIYISGLTEVDAILGNDTKFINDIVFAADKMKPEFIALCSAPIPYLNGTDFEGISRVIEKKTGIMTFFVPSNGIHDYSYGAGNAFYTLAKRLFSNKSAERSVKKAEHTAAEKDGSFINNQETESFDGGYTEVSEKKGTDRIAEKKKINIFGLTPLDYDAPGCIAGMLRQLANYEIISKWAMGSSPEELKKADQADWNLVVSVTGLKAARFMKEHLGIPYLIGAPVTGSGIDLETESGISPEAESAIIPGSDSETDQKQVNAKVYLIGEPVLMMSLAKYLADQYKIAPCVLNPLEITLDDEEPENMLWNRDEKTVLRNRGGENMQETDMNSPDKNSRKNSGIRLINTAGEEEVEALIQDADVIIADPLYRSIAPQKAVFYPMSHEAFSGRCDRKSRINLFRE